MVLCLLALMQGALSIPWAFGRNPIGTVLGDVAPQHLTRDGTLGVLIAVAGVVTAWRPRYAFAMLGVCAAIVILQLGAGAVDEHTSAVALHFELVHVLAIGIAGFIAFIAWKRDPVPGF